MTHAGSPGHGRVTVSLGVAALVPGPSATDDELVKAADQALYRAKHEGRNRVATADGPAGEATPAADELLRRSHDLGQAWQQVLRKAHDTSRKIEEQIDRLMTEKH
jgi:predicted signal transduction protein with EAL and GGDEF domain